MTLSFAATLLALFGLSLILITLALWLLRGAAPAQERTSPLARFFLIALRLAIGWHCFVEGMEKVSTPGWSSEGYLRESMGPFAGLFRGVAGDRLVDKLTVEDAEKPAFPAELDREWSIYFDAFAMYYDLTDEQYTRALGIYQQRQMDTLSSLRSARTEVAKISAYPPALKLDMTMKERLAEHDRLLGEVRKLEAQFPTSSKDVLKSWKDAKADLNKWRGELRKSADEQTAKLKSALRDVLDERQKQMPSMPDPKTTPIEYWQKLEWSDAFVKWSLVILGSFLMLGLLSRTSSLLTALLIFSFYLAMPALPGWPEPPRLEGHYVLVNKTLIEVIALLALACMPTGRWAGLDGLWHLCCSGEKK